MNIYLHHRLKQYDPEKKVETTIGRKLIANRLTNQTMFRYTYDMTENPDFEEIDLLIYKKIKDL